MKSFIALLIVLLTVIFSGCPARSLHPLFSERDARFIPALIGTWKTADASYTFEKTDGNQYKLVICSLPENDSVIYVVRSGKIGNTWFLDSYPVVHSEEHHYMSMHCITKMNISGDTLSLATLEADWLSKMVAGKKRSVPHIQREDEIILTASTKELQKFIASISSSSEAFPDPEMYIRVR